MPTRQKVDANALDPQNITAAPPQTTQAAADFNIDFDMPDDLPLDDEAMAAPSKSDEVYEPNEWTRNKLAELDLPYYDKDGRTIKDREGKDISAKVYLKAAYGIDIDAIVRGARRRGVLEAIASNDFTSPVKIYPKVGRNRLQCNATIRLRFFVREDGRLFLDTPEAHGVQLRPKLDRNGKPVMEKAADGSEKVRMEYDRNEIEAPYTKKDSEGREHTYHDRYEVYVHGTRVPLTFDEIEQLRTTGIVLGAKNIVYSDFNDTSKTNSCNVLIASDPYNRRELVVTDQQTVLKRLKNYNDFRYYTGADGGRQQHTVTLSQQEKNILASGRQIWVKGESGGNVCLQYNVAKGKIEIATDYEKAKRENAAKAQSEARKNAQSRQNAPAKVGEKI